MKILSVLNIQWSDVLVSLILLLGAFLVPQFTLQDNGTIVGAVTAIFAVTAGFFIVDATENYLTLQRLIAEENSALISIGHAISVFPEQMQAEIKKSIDAYMIAQLDIDALDHSIRTRHEFDGLINSLDVINTVPNQDEQVQHLQEQKDRLIQANQEITLAAQANITMTHWFVLFLLASIIAITTLALRDGTIGMALLVAGINIGIQTILVVLRDLDNNKFLQRKLAFRNPQQVFHAIGLPPYYPHVAPKKLCLPDIDGHYRVRQDGKIVTIDGNVCLV